MTTFRRQFCTFQYYTSANLHQQGPPSFLVGQKERRSAYRDSHNPVHLVFLFNHYVSRLTNAVKSAEMFVIFDLTCWLVFNQDSIGCVSPES